MSELWRTDNERIVAIEYQRRRPFSVLVEEHWDHTQKPWFRPGKNVPRGTVAKHFDFDWCKRDSCLYQHESGTGGDPLRFVFNSRPIGHIAEIWIAADVAIFESVKRKGEFIEVPSTRAKVERRGYRFLKQPRLIVVPRWTSSRNPFEMAMDEEQDVIYCKACDDYLPTGDSVVCDHIAWCEEHSWWAGPGVAPDGDGCCDKLPA